jgi:transketolase
MRNEFAQAIIDSKKSNENLIFLTGDLGYMALETVRDQFGEHFINTGVAEQNMVTMAASLAHEGFIPWCYSISPFVTLRPYEQIRNDVCLHNLPVKLVGNGGGFGYGIMGATHHNIEDIGAMRILPNMKVVVPFNSSDVAEAVSWMVKNPNPNYLRLNLAAKSTLSEPFAQWRKVKSGSKGVVIGTGPVLENIINLPEAEDFEIWLVSIFPILDLPLALIDSIKATGKLVTIEEHQGQCGMHESIASLILQSGISLKKFLPLFAQGYLSGKYGSQQWHQAENGLAGERLQQHIADFLK